MNKWIYAATAAATALACAPSASAAEVIYTCGASPRCDFTQANGTGGFNNLVTPAERAFDHYYAVSLSEAYKLTVSLTSASAVFGFSASELLAADRTTSLGTFSNNGELGQLVAAVVPGLYYVHVAGELLADRAKSYTGTIEIAPIPEPATWALMLTGIAAVGTALRHRARTTRIAFS
ncbi:MAG TPA: FxDxF family PEP-CTERM protein [Sphingobium sp.]|nr:FxDxF family PEP-CTERM protein [Sphingobium sp.]